MNTEIRLTKLRVSVGRGLVDTALNGLVVILHGDVLVASGIRLVGGHVDLTSKV